MAKKLKEIVIPKEKAVFWLDKNGFWNNESGRFEHKKIIDFFHASIRKDEAGYYLFQTRENYQEKVYFHYEDTALFVFDVIKNEAFTLVLNTGKQIMLEPENLSVRNDSLYVHLGKERAKFTERSMLKISNSMEFVDSDYFFRMGDRKYKLKKR